MEDAQQIDTYGKYGVVGTVVQILGSFNLVCKEHEGECDLHAQTFKIIEKGYDMGQTFNIFSLLFGIFVCLLAFIAFMTYKIRSENAK